MDNKWKNNYQWSRDYKRLRELLDDGHEVVCIADYEYTDGTKDRDICRARKIVCSNSDFKRYTVAARGIIYVDFPHWQKEYNSFEESLKEANLEFIDIKL